VNESGLNIENFDNWDGAEMPSPPNAGIVGFRGSTQPTRRYPTLIKHLESATAQFDR
jgi:hypothetical protein